MAVARGGILLLATQLLIPPSMLLLLLLLLLLRLRLRVMMCARPSCWDHNRADACAWLAQARARARARLAAALSQRRRGARSRCLSLLALALRAPQVELNDVDTTGCHLGLLLSQRRGGVRRGQ